MRATHSSGRVKSIRRYHISARFTVLFTPSRFGFLSWVSEQHFDNYHRQKLCDHGLCIPGPKPDNHSAWIRFGPANVCNLTHTAPASHTTRQASLLQCSQKSFSAFLRSTNLGFGAFSGPNRPQGSICTDFQPGRPLLKLFRAAFRTPCDCIGGYHSYPRIAV